MSSNSVVSSTVSSPATELSDPLDTPYLSAVESPHSSNGDSTLASELDSSGGVLHPSNTARSISHDVSYTNEFEFETTTNRKVFDMSQSYCAGSEAFDCNNCELDGGQSLDSMVHKNVTIRTKNAESSRTRPTNRTRLMSDNTIVASRYQPGRFSTPVSPIDAPCPWQVSSLSNDETIPNSLCRRALSKTSVTDDDRIVEPSQMPEKIDFSSLEKFEGNKLFKNTQTL